MGESVKLNQLRYFVALAEELHFRRTSERLGITQAPLSLAIQELERAIGGQLFHRSRRKVELTEIGLLLREEARDILSRLDRVSGDIRRMLGGESGEIRIGFTAAVSVLPFFPSLIHSFRIKYPDVRLLLHDMTSMKQVSAVQSRELDVGVIYSTPDFKPPADVATTLLVREPLVVAVNAGHVLASDREIRLANLSRERFLFYPKASGVGFYDHFIAMCAKRSFSPEIVQESKEALTLIGLVASGLGIAIVPAGLRYIGIANVVYVPLSDSDATTNVQMISRAGEANSRVANLNKIARAKATSWEMALKSVASEATSHS